MNQRDDLEQAIVNNIRYARSLITLRHSVLADEEKNRVLPELRRKLEARAQAGTFIGLTAEELRELMYGEDAA